MPRTIESVSVRGKMRDKLCYHYSGGTGNILAANYSRYRKFNERMMIMTNIHSRLISPWPLDIRNRMIFVKRQMERKNNSLRKRLLFSQFELNTKKTC